MQVLILAGGTSPERDVSIRSGRRVATALAAADPSFSVVEMDIDAGLLDRIKRDRPDCVVPLVHGAAGEDGALRDLLEAMRIPYIGSMPAACRLSFDKSVASALLNREGIATPPSIALPQSVFRELGAAGVMSLVTDAISVPLVVKPTRGGSALGVEIVRTAEELPAAMVRAFAYGDTVLIQEYVAGTEISISVLEADEGLLALPAVEIVPDSGIYDYSSRYTAGLTEFFVPARLSADVTERAATIALRAHEIFGLRDWSRADLIIDAEGQPWLLEVNVAPGMTETSLYPQSLLSAGLDVGTVTAGLVRRAVNR